jgi:hypothetical protein
MKWMLALIIFLLFLGLTERKITVATVARASVGIVAIALWFYFTTDY